MVGWIWPFCSSNLSTASLSSSLNDIYSLRWHWTNWFISLSYRILPFKMEWLVGLTQQNCSRIMLKDICLLLFLLHTPIHLHFLEFSLSEFFQLQVTKIPVHAGFNNKGYLLAYTAKISGIAASRDLGNIIRKRDLAIHSSMPLSPLPTIFSYNRSSSDDGWQLQVCVQ